MNLFLRNVRLPHGACDVRISRERVTVVGSRLSADRQDMVIDCRSGALLPGLHDHHLHLMSLAAVRRSVRVGPPDVTEYDAFAKVLGRADTTFPRGEWLRGIGYVETVAGDLDAHALDRLVPGRPIRVQHRSGALWMLNSAALRALNVARADMPGIERDAAGRPTGRLWRLDHWLGSRLPPAVAVDLGTVGRELARLGITGVTDATPGISSPTVAVLAQAVNDGRLPQQVHLLGTRALPPSASPRLTVGPWKVVVADHALPGYDVLRDQVLDARRMHRAVAVHCVTREALVLTLAVLEDVGARRGDRIEHAAVVPAELRVKLKRLGVRVTTQPGFLDDRGDDFAREVSAADLPFLYPYASLLAAGVNVVPSSDAPYGPLDPWRIMRAARDRVIPGGAVLGPSERTPTGVVLAAMLTRLDNPGLGGRSVHVGARADLVVLRGTVAAALADPTADQVALTICNGQLVYQADS